MARDEVFAAIVGSGFSGIAVARELKGMGVDDLVLLERAHELGGTWRDNRYPGCACDVPSHLYSFSFAPNSEWTRAYSPQPEIRAYMERLADELDVRRHVRYGQDVVRARWDEDTARWELEMRSGDTLAARVLVMAVGALSNPDVPKIPGAERFRGASFHSATWDESYDLRGKRVAVIGTGASAIQFVPQIQPLVSKLHLFQRTPPWVMPKDDRVFGALERLAFRSVPGYRWFFRQQLFWRHESTIVFFGDHPLLSKLAMREGKRHIARYIRDPELRKLLTPSYRPGCKRILLSNDYYPALAQPNVDVIGEGIVEIGEREVRTASKSFEVDAILYGTGFRVHDYVGRMEIAGRKGESLGARWERDGAQAFLGTMVTGFPNFFTMTGPNVGLGNNSMIVMIEGQARYVREAIRTLRERDARTIEPKPEVEAAYNEWIRDKTRDTVWTSGCRSWYLDDKGRNGVLWPALASSFRRRIADFDPDDHVLSAPVHERTLLDSAEARIAHVLARLPSPLQQRLAGKRTSLDGDTLLPEIELTLAVRARISAPTHDELGAERARKRFRRDTLVHRGALDEIGAMRDLEVDGAAGKLRARLYSARGRGEGALPLLVYYHGGGFVFGDLDTHEPACRIFAAFGRMHVLAIDYRLAPEHRFPAAADDAIAAFRWAVRNAQALGADPARIGVGGDSAGANLSAVVSLAQRERGPRPALQLLLYPPVDRTKTWPSLELFAHGFLLEKSEIDWFNEQYVGDHDRRDPRVSPLLAPDHSNLPPAFVVTAAFDPLRDEGEAYARALRDAGTPVVLRRIPGQVHGFVNLAGVSPSSRETLIAIAKDTGRMFDRPAVTFRALEATSPR